MTEQQIKQLCKLAIEKSNRPFTKEEKELLKKAVEKAQKWEELFSVVMSSLLIN